MVWLGLSLVLIAAVIMIMLAGMIKAEVAVSRIGEEDEAQIRLSALGGLIRMKLEIPYVLSYGWHHIAARLELVDLNRDKLLKEKRKLAKIGGLKGRSKRLRKLRKLAAAAHLGQWAKAALKRVHCSDVHWSTEIGTGEAADTAVAAGMIWALKGTLLGYALHFVKLEQQPVLTVTPLFGSMRFTTRFRCIIRMRLGHAIGAGLCLLVRIMKAKGGFKTWRSTQYKA